MPDEHGYPTDKELEMLQLYCVDLQMENLMEHLRLIWHHPDWGIVMDGPEIELHTGGWSGNEEIIRTMVGTMFWAACWQMSKRGGHYYFTVPSALQSQGEEQ